VREWLGDNPPRRLVYVSCNPVTLSRDLGALVAVGYVLDDIRLFDFYPQTSHVEAVAKLHAASHPPSHPASHPWP
jgi:23S rRNA (uracil1939-C5)-methyltransferase